MNYEYDIAISYKNEMEQTAAKIHDYLVEDGWRVFFAPVRQQEMLSEKIHQMLYGIYKNKSFMKVLLISESYLEGEWTSLEKRMSLESTKDNRKRLLIVNYSGQVILPGDLQSLQYLDGSKYEEDQIAALITERLKKYTGVNSGNNFEKKEYEKHCYGKNSSCVINNKGVIAGDNAHFNNISF